jgi:hypothetical protein
MLNVFSNKDARQIRTTHYEARMLKSTQHVARSMCRARMNVK